MIIMKRNRAKERMGVLMVEDKEHDLPPLEIADVPDTDGYEVIPVDDDAPPLDEELPPEDEEPPKSETMYSAQSTPSTKPFVANGVHCEVCNTITRPVVATCPVCRFGDLIPVAIGSNDENHPNYVPWYRKVVTTEDGGSIRLNAE